MYTLTSLHRSIVVESISKAGFALSIPQIGHFPLSPEKVKLREGWDLGGILTSLIEDGVVEEILIAEDFCVYGLVDPHPSP